MQPTRLSIPDLVRAEFSSYFESPSESARPALFRNPWPHGALPTLGAVLRWKTGGKAARPSGYRAQALPAVPAALAAFAAGRGEAATRMFWIGHASFLLELDGARFVVDPIFGRAGGLVPRVTPPAAQPGELDGALGGAGHAWPPRPPRPQLAEEPRARQRRADPVRGAARACPWRCPRECANVVELDWWQHVTIDGVRVHLVPAQHWHRRGVLDHNKGLWGGYVLEGTHRVYHSGDTGYFGGFSAIGKVFGGIDAACLPLGAYEPRWFMGAQHMSPEQSLQALLDLSAHTLRRHALGRLRPQRRAARRGPQAGARGRPRAWGSTTSDFTSCSPVDT